MRCVQLSRRAFLKATGISTTGFILGHSWSGAAGPGIQEFKPNAFIVINRDGGISYHISIPEIGQNTRTALAMILSDELGADLHSVDIRQAPPRNDMGHQTAGASQGISMSWDNIRRSAAAAREMLINGAAAEWKVNPANCRTLDNAIHGPGNRSMSFADAVPFAARQEIPENPPLKNASDYRYVGKPVRSLDAREIGMGKTVFGSDAMPPGVRFAVVIRCPVYLGTIKSWDGSAARAMRDVVDVLQIGDSIAVIAANTWAAINASRAVSIDWDPGKHGEDSTDKLITRQRNGVRDPEQTGWKTGDFEQAYKSSPVKFEREFSAPALAHCPMEPPTCTAWYHDGGVEIWGTCQSLNRLYDTLPEYAGLPREKITWHQLRVGGGFGRKLAQDYIEEALAIARMVDYPVKLIFTREDDIRHDRYRAPDRYRYVVGMREDGFPLALEETSARRNIIRDANDIALMFPNVVRKCTFVEPPFPTGPMRAPRHNISCFTEQSLLDCMAETAGVDPMEYRLALLGHRPSVTKLGWEKSPVDDPVMVELLQTVNKRSEWKSDPAYGYGVAYFQKRNTRVAIVALAPKTGGGRPIQKVFLAVNCGRVINPLGAHAQMEGGIVDGIAAALYQKIEVRNGSVIQGNLHDYPMLEMKETPEMDITLMESSEAPDGMGEMAYPPMMAVTASAIYAVTGKRTFDLPIRG